MKKYLIYLMMAVPVMTFGACSPDNDYEPETPGIETPDNPDEPGNPDARLLPFRRLSREFGRLLSCLLQLFRQLFHILRTGC